AMYHDVALLRLASHRRRHALQGGPDRSPQERRGDGRADLRARREPRDTRTLGAGVTDRGPRRGAMSVSEGSIHPATRLGAAHLTVSDPAVSTEFYRDRLGFVVHEATGETARLHAGGDDLLVLRAR